jgi:glycerol uptake facilitator-like aquaporin
MRAPRPNSARALSWDFWIYVVGPSAGAALGALAYQAVRQPEA